VIEGLSAREKQIIQVLTDEPAVTGIELGRRLGVSVVTIRTDLKNLANRGFITRTHGGALPAFHKSILDRQAVKSDEKNRIAKAAADLIQDGDTVMILAGTTTALIPKFLLGKGHIHIVTDSTLLFPYVRSNPALSLTVVGGEFRSSTESFGGPMAIEAIDRFNVKLAFLGTDGFSLERGLSTHLVEGAEMVKAMAAHADRSVLLADASKYGRTGFVTIMPLRAVDTLISDSEFNPATAELLRQEGLEVLLV
jgi:DeoR family transcriptional regulator, galactitol utilization operon repressor